MTTNIALVFGGMSSEHQVSCLTAASVLRTLDPERYTITCIGIAPDGRWTLPDNETVAALATVDGTLPSVSPAWPEAVLVRTARGPAVSIRDGNQLDDPRPVDVALPLLHGPFGEDGTIQGLFEMHGIRYVGSGVAASAIGMDKALMKMAFAAAGLPQGPYVVVGEQASDEQIAAQVAPLGLPVFVKPARAGSSMGISKVNAPDELAEAVKVAREHDPKLVIEAGVMGAREIECAVLGGRAGARARASLLGEIRMSDPDAFYDFDAKYLPEEQVSLDVPATVEADLQARLQELAIRTFEAVGAEGLSRVDFFVRGDELLVNEINTLPGFTQYSMYPSLWQATGMSYGELLDELIALALERPVGLR